MPGEILQRILAPRTTGLATAAHVAVNVRQDRDSNIHNDTYAQ
jgi:hypothetical protein